MSKNVVVCCDGTANEFSIDRTNVVKLFFTLRNDPAAQVAYYHPGIGTMEPPGALTGLAKRLTRVADQTFGSGLERDIRDAYIFIANNFEDGDRLFLFGFSRGAYTVRALASLLRMYGLTAKGSDAFVPYAIRMFTGINRDRPAAVQAETGIVSPFKLAAAFKATFSRECRPHFVGVWDTVSSVGWIENPLWLPYSADNGDILIGRHAIAIDEPRAFFRTNLWRPNTSSLDSGPHDLKQVWFPGAHADVGGGYPEAESALSKVALEWMLYEAEAAGLAIDDRRMATILGENGDEYVKPDPLGELHISLTWAWWPAEFVFKRHYNWTSREWERRMNLGRPRTIPEGSLIHDSAFLRGADYLTRLPKAHGRVATVRIGPRDSNANSVRRGIGMLA
jgi:uncharacterized protein (DUF2235 family)